MVRRGAGLRRHAACRAVHPQIPRQALPRRAVPRDLQRPDRRPRGVLRLRARPGRPGERRHDAVQHGHRRLRRAGGVLRAGHTDVLWAEKAAGERANSSCGGHVHIGANYLTSPQAFYNLEELWANNERILYAISNKEGEKPRDSITSYATPVSGEFERTLPDTVRINNEDDLESLKKRIAEKQPSRYRSLNFQNLGEGGKGTIEFRLSNGTVDAKTWIENINLYGGLVRAAQEISLIQAKPEEERTEEEAEKLAIFDRLGTDESLQGEERLEYLLKLAIPDPKKREVYRGRYRVNNELINDDYSLTERFDNDVSKKLVRYSDKKAIGKEIFTGENAVNGEMMEDVGEFISNDQQQLNIDQTHSTDDDIK